MSKILAPEVSVIDYGMGNLFSVKQACEQVGLKTIIATNKKDILGSDGVVLPGVGAFCDAMANLEKLGLISAIRDFIQSGKPFMGICLGMQLLMSESEEFGRYRGLDVIRGRVVKFPLNGNSEEVEKVPQVGWNGINNPSTTNGVFWSSSPLAGIASGEFMYFVHSYYCKPEDDKVALSVTRYAQIDYCSSILWKNVFACQFHPEKSAAEGLRIYNNWSTLVKNAKGK